MTRRPPRSPLFPYPTLSRSVVVGQDRRPPLSLERQDFFREVRHDTHPLVEEPPRGGRLGNASVHRRGWTAPRDRKSTRLNSSHSQISYAVFCLKKKKYSAAC